MAVRAGPYTGVAGLGRAALAVAVIVTAALVVRAFARRGVATRSYAFHMDPGGNSRTTARHEAGHKHVGEAAGGRCSSVSIYPDGSGITYVTLPRKASVIDHVALNVAGQVASGTSAGCGSDHAKMRAVLRTLPPGERAAAKRAGYAQAGRIVNGFWGNTTAVRDTTEHLLRHGQIR